MRTKQEQRKTIGGQFAQAGAAIVFVILLTQGHSTHAGVAGLVNGRGVGWASAEVGSSTLNTNRVITSTNTSLPSAAMAPTTGYKVTGPLPAGASSATYARMKAISGGSWQGSVKADNGDNTGNAELERRIPIDPSDCASLDFDTKVEQTEGTSGLLTVNADATGGTALWLRGFEFTGPMDDVPVDDPSTPENESIEYLKIHGTFKFEMLLLGPFKYGGSDGAICPLLIPFTLNSSNLDNLIVSADVVAKSNPLLLYCPDNIVVQCGEPVVYGQVSYAGCGDIAITYSPESTYAFPVGVTPVTVTATDADGNSTNCSFTVTVLDTTPPVVPELPVLKGECSVEVNTTPTATDICGTQTKTVVGTTSDPLIYNTQGTFTIHWSFNDGNGNTVVSNQTVIVKDVTPPASVTLPTLTSSCGSPVTVTAPTTTDNCAGTITGTTSDPLTYSSPGTNIVHWTFSDGNGNSTTANQKVVVAGLTFQGFYSPVSGIGGTCSSPVYVANLGSKIPFKFDVKCGDTFVTDGPAPTVAIQRYTNNCSPDGAAQVQNAEYQNDWHYNWDSSVAKKGIYKITVVLPDGSSQFVFIKLK